MSTQEAGPTPLMPTGSCWCGCGEYTSVGAFFSLGHDKRAEAAIVKVVYGSVPALLVAHGYGPGGRNPSVDLEEYKKGGGDYL
jgi:hypothetical protein